MKRVAVALSKQLTKVDGYNVFLGIGETCSKFGNDLVVQCEHSYQDCLNDVSSKKRHGQCE